MKCIVRVTVVQARKLVKSDLLLNKSDPYVVITIGGTKKRTKKIRRNLNPVFNERIDFALRIQPERVRIEVYDFDMYGVR